MTTLTAMAAPPLRDEDANLPPVPWRRMAWVTWRQHRIALAGMAVFLGAVAVFVAIAGRQLHHTHAAVLACNPAAPVCADLITHFNVGLNFMNHVLVGGYLLQVVPALIGAFIGAPVLARELETGTFRYAWTQGFGRWRWTLAKLLALAVVVVAAAGALGLLFSWYYQPYFASGNQALSLSTQSPFAPALFDLRGVAFPAWALVAFAIGVLAGMLIRRVVPAIVATLAVYTGVALVAANLVRRHYLAPLVTTKTNLPASVWTYSQQWTKGGTFSFSSWRDAPSRLIQQCSAIPVGPLGKPAKSTLAQCFAQHGYTLLTSYQPVSRFWAFQWIEGAWLLALSALLITTTVWLVRRRAA